MAAVSTPLGIMVTKQTAATVLLQAFSEALLWVELNHDLADPHVHEAWAELADLVDGQTAIVFEEDE